jgi:uncharacterized LabA/DUF88 family protein
MRTIAYIDGFNLYYRMLKRRPAAKWLDPKALVERILHRSHRITRVNFYTARLSSRLHDPEAPARQAVYLQALSSIPELAVHEGKFLPSDVWMEPCDPLQARPADYVWTVPGPNLVKVRKFEEKGSDVNLGAHLVRDAFTNAFEEAVVLTNDSDLVEPIRIAVQEAGKRVGLLVPVKFPTKSLMDVASFHLHVRPGHLLKAQFPDEVTCPGGHVATRPPSWR